MSKIIDFKLERKNLEQKYRGIPLERKRITRMGKKTPVEVISMIRGSEELRENIPECAKSILQAFGTLIATYITIIKLITGYLFNKEEETTMKDIISNIQEYDMQLRGNKKSEHK